MNNNKRKPILCLDFDGVCHSYTSGWLGADVIPDPPVDGLKEFLEQALTVFDVHIFSSRSHQEGGIVAMVTWFWQHCGVEITEAIVFPTAKPPATVSIDDRALTFTGKWPTVESLQNFKTWQKNSI
jgi:hypothetical protein